jgi:AcrR family transcriptional regulator
MFLDRGIEDVTVEQISAAAGVAPATFYRYFGTKDGVLFAYEGGFVDALREAAAQAPNGSRSQQLGAVLQAFAEHLDRSAAVLARHDEIVARNPTLLPRAIAVQRDWEDELACGLAGGRGLHAPDLAAQLDAAVGLVIIRASFRRWRSGSADSVRAALAGILRDVAATGTAFPSSFSNPSSEP